MRALPAASHFINNVIVESEAGQTFTSACPATGEVFAELTAATPVLEADAASGADCNSGDLLQPLPSVRSKHARRYTIPFADQAREVVWGLESDCISDLTDSQTCMFQ